MGISRTLMNVIVTGLGAWFLWDATRRILQKERELTRAKSQRSAAQSWEGEGGALKGPTPPNTCASQFSRPAKKYASRSRLGLNLVM